MRELDLLLERFLAADLAALPEEDLGRLESLLEEPDQDILAWLSGGTGPVDPDMLRIVTLIRERIH